MITIKTPDGGIATFPDGTAPDVIKSAMAKKFAANNTKAAMDALHPAQAEFEALPAWQKPITALGDLALLGTSGATFGLAESTASESGKKRIQYARERSGLPGTLAEISSTLASPVTRGISAAGKLIAPTSKGLLPWLAKLGISTGEGAAFGGLEAAGHGTDIIEGLETGAALGGGTHAASKLIPAATKYVVSGLTNKEPEVFNRAFTSGQQGGTIADSFRAGQKGKYATAAQQEYQKGLDSLSKGTIDIVPIDTLWTKLQKSVKEGNISRLSTSGQNKVAKMDKTLKELAKNPTVQTMDAARGNLSTYSKSGDPQIKRLSTTLQNEIKQQVQKVDKRYVPILEKYKETKLAQTAGKKLSKFAPFTGSEIKGIISLLTGGPRGLGTLAYLAGKTSKYLPAPSKAGLLVGLKDKEYGGPR
jgi:hypothetical protein